MSIFPNSFPSVERPFLKLKLKQEQMELWFSILVDEDGSPLYSVVLHNSDFSQFLNPVELV